MGDAYHLAHEFVDDVFVFVCFGWFEPVGDFFLGFFEVAAGVDEVGDADFFAVGVTKAHVGVVAADGAHFGGFWLGGADYFADEGDGFYAF